jgi:hypothetical protein
MSELDKAEEAWCLAYRAFTLLADYDGDASAEVTGAYYVFRDVYIKAKEKDLQTIEETLDAT